MHALDGLTFGVHGLLSWAKYGMIALRILLLVGGIGNRAHCSTVASRYHGFVCVGGRFCSGVSGRLVSCSLEVSVFTACWRRVSFVLYCFFFAGTSCEHG